MIVEPGTMIGGRYRVQRRAWDGVAGPAWLALDTILDRPVLVQTFPEAAREAVAHAVAAAAQVSHAGLAQIYDMSADPLGIVFEHAPGGRLVDRKDGALPVPAAAAVTCQLVGALAALHEHNIPHGAVGPETVMFDEEGRAKLSGTAVASALGDHASEGYRPNGEATDEERDRYALAGIAYRLFTGREPGPDAPPARTARRSIPPEVDSLLARGLARDRSVRPSLAEFTRILTPLTSVEPVERGPGFVRQEARWLVPALFLVGLGVTAVIVGVQTGAITIGGDGGVTASPPPSRAAYNATAADFDPPPGNGEEHPKQTGFVLDGKDTFWSTVGYNGPNLDGRKKGVGLLFDLGQARSVARIEIDTPFPGWKAEWRVADTKGDQAQDFRVVEDFTATGDAVVIDGSPTARYWLLWITELVEIGADDDHPFGAQVSEIRFLPPV
jgi:serine/threonine protein kinase